MARSINAVKAALWSKLANDGTLNAMLAGSQYVFDGMAPQETARPYIIFQIVSGVPSHSFSGRVYDNDLILVKGLTDGFSTVAAGQIAERIDTLLDDGTLSISGRTLLYMRRDDDVEYAETTGEGVRINHSGAQYRCWVK